MCKYSVDCTSKSRWQLITSLHFHCVLLVACLFDYHEGCLFMKQDFLLSPFPWHPAHLPCPSAPEGSETLHTDFKGIQETQQKGNLPQRILLTEEVISIEQFNNSEWNLIVVIYYIQQCLNVCEPSKFLIFLQRIE